MRRTYLMPAPRDISTVRQPGPNAPDRRCAEDGCITVLNRWHDGDRCYAHSASEQLAEVHHLTRFEDLMEQRAA
jgi:hypothetical protein